MHPIHYLVPFPSTSIKPIFVPTMQLAAHVRSSAFCIWSHSPTPIIFYFASLLLRCKLAINKDDRPEWSLIRSVIMRVLQNRTTVKWESDLLITTMFTDRIGRHEVLLQINHNNYNFRQKIHLNTSIKLKFLQFGNSPVFHRISCCCYGSCDRLFDWWI